MLSFLEHLKELNPSLHFHYRNFITTTIQSVTPLRFGSLWDTLNYQIVVRLLAHRSGSFSRSLKEPLQDSCRLNPGWPVISMQFVHYNLSYRYSKIWSFVNKYAFRDVIERFTFVQLSCNHLTPLWCLFFIAQYHNFWLQHHEVVYILLLQGVYEGPSLISFKASKRIINSFHSWNSRVGKGISAQAPHKTVLETLTSHGFSHCSIKRLLHFIGLNPIIPKLLSVVFS